MRRGLRFDPRTVVGALLAATLAFWGLNAAMEPARSQTPSPTISVHATGSSPRSDNGMVYVALIGSDAPTGTPDVGGGCDSIHIISINKASHAGTILNMPRDLFICGRKITDICRSGGFDAGIATSKQFTGIPIQFYARPHFRNFMQLVDSLGGLDIPVYPPMFTPADTGTHFNPGAYHLFGGDT